MSDQFLELEEAAGRRPAMSHGVTVAINQCPNHRDYWSISVDKERSGTRITPGKCCGRWHVVREWTMTPTKLREAARVFEDAAEELERAIDDGDHSSAPGGAGDPHP